LSQAHDLLDWGPRALRRNCSLVGAMVKTECWPWHAVEARQSHKLRPPWALVGAVVKIECWPWHTVKARQSHKLRPPWARVVVKTECWPWHAVKARKSHKLRPPWALVWLFTSRSRRQDRMLALARRKSSSKSQAPPALSPSRSRRQDRMLALARRRSSSKSQAPPALGPGSYSSSISLLPSIYRHNTVLDLHQLANRYC